MDIANKYSIITPAHNEEAYLERTIRSVISQHIRRVRWVIVNDNSNDNTPKIVARFARSHPFIQLVNMARPAGRHFGNKVRAFNRGLIEICASECDYIGNLDADVSFDPDYYQRVLQEFASDSRLGIAGGMIYTCMGKEYASQNVALDSVAGAVQCFRRECFDEIGGYLALPYGGIDTAAEVTARMKGWKVRTLQELRVLEHRRTGSATAGPLASRIKEGRRMQSLGSGPQFFFLRCIYRANEPPMFLGSCAACWGYIVGRLTDPVALGPEAVRYLHAEHRGKLKRLFRFPSRPYTS